MMAKLDRFPTQDDEVKVWDLSLLSPEDQDRAYELISLIESAEEDEAEGLEPILAEFQKLVDGLPLLGPDDPEQGPLIKIPDELRFYWTWSQPASNWRSYDFCKLGKVQTLRFVQLCEQYGYESGLDNAGVRKRMIPRHHWQADDRAEVAEMLAVASKRGSL